MRQAASPGILKSQKHEPRLLRIHPLNFALEQRCGTTFAQTAFACILQMHSGSPFIFCTSKGSRKQI